jgi:hypothetical protein
MATFLATPANVLSRGGRSIGKSLPSSVNLYSSRAWRGQPDAPDVYSEEYDINGPDAHDIEADGDVLGQSDYATNLAKIVAAYRRVRNEPTGGALVFGAGFLNGVDSEEDDAEGGGPATDLSVHIERRGGALTDHIERRGGALTDHIERRGGALTDHIEASTSGAEISGSIPAAMRRADEPTKTRNVLWEYTVASQEQEGEDYNNSDDSDDFDDSDDSDDSDADTFPDSDSLAGDEKITGRVSPFASPY